MDEELFTRDSPKKSTRRRVEPENTTKEKSMGDKLKNETSAADSYRKKLRHKQSNVKEGKTTPPKMFTEDTLLSAMEKAGADETPDEAERKSLHLNF